MVFKLPEEIETPEQLAAAAYEIQRYADWLDSNKVRHKTGAPKLATQPALAPQSTAVLEAWQADHPADKPALEELVTTLEGFQPPIIHITLVDIATPALLHKLVTWVRANGDPKTLVQLVADSTIGGGVVIRTPNHLYDHSFRSQLLAHRSALTKVIANVR